MGDQNMSVTFNSHGIQFMYDGRKIKKPMVNPSLAPLMDSLCEELAKYGFIKVYTYGILCNRPMRRNSKKTSKHSNGLMYKYEAWEDGSSGSLAFDSDGWGHQDPSRSKYLHDKNQRAWMIAVLRKHGFQVYHTGEKGDPKVTPDMLHAEVKL